MSGDNIQIEKLEEINNNLEQLITYIEENSGDRIEMVEKIKSSSNMLWIIAICTVCGLFLKIIFPRG